MALRYRHMKDIAYDECTNLSLPQGMEWEPVTPDDADTLSTFLTSIPSERTAWFNPHPFDPTTLRRMAASHSFVMLKVTYQGKIIGYHFLRCFFIGKAFHGLIVAEEMAGHGIGTQMWQLGAAICTRAGMAMEATIHRDNTASLASCRRGCNTTVITTLPNGYLHIGIKIKN